jgi:hypothetical protein
MAKISIEEIPPVPVKPQIKVILELNLDEAVVLTKICGKIRGCGETRDVTENIYKLMRSNDRIFDLALKMEMENYGVPHYGFDVGHCVIPKE